MPVNWRAEGDWRRGLPRVVYWYELTASTGYLKYEIPKGQTLTPRAHSSVG